MHLLRVVQSKMDLLVIELWVARPLSSIVVSIGIHTGRPANVFALSSYLTSLRLGGSASLASFEAGVSFATTFINHPPVFGVDPIRGTEKIM
jgi:hypothetical protein